MSERPSRAASPPPKAAGATANGPASAVATGSETHAWPWPVLTAEGLEHIKNHKYKPGVYTPLDNMLNGTWLWLTECLPIWFAPNLVTFAGFVPMVLSYVLAWIFSPDFSTPAPRWLAFYTGASLLMYQTFDAMDGKQARRTKSSSPLGQLFDHGCDCLACLSHHSMASMVLLPGASRSCVFGLVALQTGFFMAQWQEYYTGVLCTSFGPVGVTESQYGLMAAAFAATVLGPERVESIFRQEIRMPWGAEPLPCGILAVYGWVLFCASLCAISASKTVIEARPAGKLRQSLVDLTSPFLLNLCILFWHPDSLTKGPRLICVITGLLFFYYTAQMIVFSMARMKFPALQPTLLPFIVAAILSHSSAMREMHHVALQLFAICISILVVLWLLQVIRELKQKLGISVFDISHAKQS